MQTTRLIFTIQKDEKDALRTLAAREYRDYRAQAALIIRQELERRGLLPQIEPPALPIQETNQGGMNVTA